MNYTQADINRRKLLNEELNPRVEIKDEATQTINPITGRNYDSLNELYGRLESTFLEEDLDFSHSKNNTDSNINYFKNNSLIKNNFLSDYLNKKKKTTIELQFALARMDVESKPSFSEFDYMEARKNARTLIKRLNDADIGLGIISSPVGLNAGIRDMSYKSLADDFYKDINSKSPLYSMK
jgi:hypothetical protein